MADMKSFSTEVEEPRNNSKFLLYMCLRLRVVRTTSPREKETFAPNTFMRATF